MLKKLVLLLELLVFKYLPNQLLFFPNINFLLLIEMQNPLLI